ncbi:hypothetical protein VC77_10330 [Vibrio cholerae]|nr:hypothetical protein VC77_10330 [Vibrio cholerae]
MLFCSINYKKRGRLSVIFHTYQKNPLVKWLDNRNVTKDCLSHNIFPVRDGKDADLLPKQISLKTKGQDVSPKRLIQRMLLDAWRE